MEDDYDDPGLDWSQEHRFEALTDLLAVRETVEASAARARRSTSAQQFLWRAGLVLPGLDASAARGRARALDRGYQTGKQRAEDVPLPVGTAIVAALCSLALHGQAVKAVEQRDDGCTLIADIPSDRKTFGGTLWVALTRRDAETTAVDARIEIPGQVYDWGKSKQVLAALFAEFLAPR